LTCPRAAEQGRVGGGFLHHRHQPQDGWQGGAHPPIRFSFRVYPRHTHLSRLAPCTARRPRAHCDPRHPHNQHNRITSLLVIGRAAEAMTNGDVRNTRMMIHLRGRSGEDSILNGERPSCMTRYREYCERCFVFRVVFIGPNF
jgi:hypothetical protein